MPHRIHIVGRRNCGKTTLVCELVRELTARGLRVATIKHTHHRHELDTPGKDSWQHREAGAAAVGILSPGMTAMFVPSQREGRGEDRYALFETQFADCDLILVEGDLQTTAPRLEVWRAACGEAPYAQTDRAIAVLITDDDPEFTSVDVWHRSDVVGLAGRLVELTLNR